jgi:arylsulfatase A-like enzyme
LAAGAIGVKGILKPEPLASALSICVTLGFTVGFAVSTYSVLANRFIQHSMFRSITLTLQDNLSKWTLLIGGGLVALSGVGLILFLILRYVLRKSLSESLEIRAMNVDRLRALLLTSVIFGATLFYGVWLVNHHLLQGKFHLISILADLGVLCFVLCLGWFLLKAKIFIGSAHNKALSRYGASIVAGCLVLFMIALSAYNALDAKIRAPTGPSLVLVLSDTLRQDHLGCYGYTRNTSPGIDEFAESSTLFKNAFAQSPATKASIASLFTSKYPGQHNVVHKRECLNLAHVTLAEKLRDSRYATAGYIENPVISRQFQYDQGFGRWELDDRRARGNRSMSHFDEGIFSWLESHSEEAFFLYVHYLDPHDPYRAPDPFYHSMADPDWEDETGAPTSYTLNDNKEYYSNNRQALDNVIALYDEEISYVDSRFQKLIAKLDALNILDETVVVFLSDHGEGFLEHGEFFHSYSVNSELINIPLIIRCPGLLDPGVEEQYVQHIDLFPTIAHMLDIDTGNLPLEGNDILTTSDMSTKVFSEHLREGRTIRQRCVVSEGWKLIYHIDIDDYYLFNIRTDPFEYNDLANAEADIAGELKECLTEWNDGLQGKTDPSETRLRAEVRDRLKGLGYIH